jgi:hypothetical protein
MSEYYMNYVLTLFEFGAFMVRVRDDIHKSAPVSRAYRSFMKACARESDAKFRRESALRAVVQDCKRELTLKAVRQLTEIAGQHDFMSQATFVASPADCTHVLSQQARGHVERRLMQGEAGVEAVQGGIKDAIAERAESELRSMKGHVLKDGGKGCEGMIRAMETSLRDVGFDEIATQVVSGKLHTPPRVNREKSVNLDENIL